MKEFCTFLLAFLMFQMALSQTNDVTKPEQGQSTYIVSGSQTLEAFQSITLGPGTHIQSGSTFTARIVETDPANDPYSTITLSAENYIFTRSFQKGMTSFSSGSAKEGDVMESIVYFDGLGRPMQVVGIKSAPDKEDFVTHMEYDLYGRQVKEWLPYHEPTGSLGSYRGNVSSATQSFYKSSFASDFSGLSTANVNAYSQKDFEPSPLNRVLEQAAPGEDWKLGNGHEIEFGYEANVASEVRRFSVNLSYANNTYTPSLVNDGHYSAGELYKNITRDENHTSGTNHTTEEFTDKLGRVVLKRTHNNGDHDTYYVYDDYGNLTYVIPPKVTTDNVSTTELNELCYQYIYDDRNRLVEKKLPGKGKEYIVYNTLDQPIMTQDSKQDSASEWLFTQYDAFGRVAYTGIDTGNGSSRSSVQTSANGATNQFVSRTISGNSYAGTTVYYTKNAYPTSFDQVYTINYYDTYVDADGLSVPSSVLGQTAATNVKGLPTVSKVRVLGTNDWITTITGYDVKGRAIYTASKNNYLNTTDIVESELDFGGKVVQTKTTHQRTGNSDIVTTDVFTYDHEGRLLRQKQTISGQAQQTLVDNTYDELGQLEKKKVGGGLQTVDYAYNVRGWLKQINNPSSLGSDLFAFDINYNTADHGGSALYNGNISETEWKTSNDNVLRWYRYGYDPLNRITSATSNSANYHLSSVTYDKNGNILGLNRKGHTNSGATSFGTMDNLVYTYDSGNKLTKVLDNGNDNYGFVDGVDQTIEYTYDANGNMTMDLNKGIQANGITYNHLNLPVQVTINGNNIDYLYDATGTKLQKTVGSSVTVYAGNYIYSGPSGSETLQFFSHPEGYVYPDGQGGYGYVYQYKDHLGNIRLSYTDDPSNPGTPTIIEENNYYPFGLKHKGYNTGGDNSLGNSVAQKWKFGGKELDDSFDGALATYDFGARNYDPALGRWMNIDPLADKNYSWTPFRYGYNNPIKFVDPDGMYERDGHYWTVYLAGLVTGRSDAGSLAYWAEEPDHVMSSRGDVLLATNTWMYPRNQRDWHALTGGLAVDERVRSRQMFNGAGGSQQRGYALHRLGDSYAHSKDNGRMYKNGVGHAFQGHAPDIIANRPELYLEYVNDLVGTLGGDSKTDLFTFEYVANSGGTTEQNSAVFEAEIRLREGVNTFSVLGDQTGVIGDYIDARNENYGSNTSYKTVTAEADSYKLNKETGEWEKSGTETRTFVIFK